MSQHFTPGDAARAEIVRKAKALIKRGEHDPVVKAALERANQELVRLKSVSGSLHVDSTLSNISVQYRNEAFIGALLMPVVQVAKKKRQLLQVHQARHARGARCVDVEPLGSERDLEEPHDRQLLDQAVRPHGLRRRV